MKPKNIVPGGLSQEYTTDLSLFQKSAMKRLTPAQEEHISRMYPEIRQEMEDFLVGGVDVCIGPQNEAVPRFAIWPAEDPSFLIDCCDTVEKAVLKAESLGLRVWRIKTINRKMVNDAWNIVDMKRKELNDLRAISAPGKDVASAIYAVDDAYWDALDLTDEYLRQCTEGN